MNRHRLIRNRRFTCDHCGAQTLRVANQETFACSRCDGTCRLPCTDAEVTRQLTRLVKRLEAEVGR